MRRSFPALTDYIRIPNKSPAFDPDWASTAIWKRPWRCSPIGPRRNSQQFPGSSLEVVRLQGRTPLIFIEVPGTAPGTVLMYGHLDKQPEMLGWDEGKGPWQP